LCKWRDLRVHDRGSWAGEDSSLDGLSGNVISLYAKGMTTGDIRAHLLEIYGTEISRETISKKSCGSASNDAQTCGANFRRSAP
jgi:hypothetical protein